MSRRPALLALGAAAVAASVGASVLTPAQAGTPVSDHLTRPLAGPDSATFPGSEVPVGDVDDRGPRLPALPSARRVVQELGDVEVSWNLFGTPSKLTRSGTPVATGFGGAPVDGARAFLTARAGLLGLSVDEIAGLELLTDTVLSGSDVHEVVFRQRLGGLPLAEAGLVGVTLVDGQVFAVSSSIVPSAVLGDAPSLTPRLGAVDAVLAAARELGISTLGGDDLELLDGLNAAGFSVVQAAGLAQQQLARLRVLPTTDRGARLVWETAVQDVAGGRALAAASYVDDLTGDVLLRRDAVDTAAQGTASTARAVSLPSQAIPGIPAPTTGSYTAPACSDPIPLVVPAGTQSIAVVAATTDDPTADITIQVRRNGASAGSTDTLSQPEVGAVAVTPAATATDVFEAAVCPFDPAVPGTVGFVFTYATSDQAGDVPTLPDVTLPGAGLSGPATLRAFLSNPSLSDGSDADRLTLCVANPGDSSTKDLSDCLFTGLLGSPQGWDTIAGVPTFNLQGNNAVTSNAQASTSLTPGPPLLTVPSPTRDYDFPFSNAWEETGCDPGSIALPPRADVDAAAANLFAGHNATHDFAYRLGLVEEEGALQTLNFGKPGAPGDPELGNTQNAALTQAVFPVTNEVTTPTAGLGLTGRNNANQITLMDGVPGITNQYLFEPIPGFYGPCHDGDLDASIFLHEYTHAISNRLVGGPDIGLSGAQGQSMGESWSDLVALEYLQAFGVAGAQGEDPYSVGAYATGDPFVGIRDYNLRPSANPLTYGQFGFDTTGPEVHADGEIWNVVNTEVRQALIEKYDALGLRFDDAALQQACALGFFQDGREAPSFDGCPGNRRWVTYLFDGMLMEETGAPTMVDIKDLMLASAGARGGDDVDVMARAFAERGLGVSSAAEDGEDVTPQPGYDTLDPAQNATVTFSIVDAATGQQVPGNVHLGVYSARATPVAAVLGGVPVEEETPAPDAEPGEDQEPDPAEEGDATDAPADAVAPVVGGEQFDVVVQAQGYGLQRFTATFPAGQAVTQVFEVDRNLASSAAGATIADAGGAVRPEDLIDDDEATNTGFDGSADETPVEGRAITVALPGPQVVGSIAVSALHRPADTEDPTDFQGRQKSLRDFALQASLGGGEFVTVYDSRAEKAAEGGFFPGGAPRPVAPDLQLRTVELPRSVQADSLRLVVQSNQCTGSPTFTSDELKSATATAVNGTSDCRSDVLNATQVTVTELQAFAGVLSDTTIIPPAAAPGGTGGTGGGSGSGGTGGTLAATGTSGAVGALGLLAMATAGALVRRRRTA